MYLEFHLNPLYASEETAHLAHSLHTQDSELIFAQIKQEAYGDLSTQHEWVNVDVHQPFTPWPVGEPAAPSVQAYDEFVAPYSSFTDAQSSSEFPEWDNMLGTPHSMHL